MDKCPECAEHPDCFACINGKCTALSENGGQGCVFYKPEQQALQEVQRAYSLMLCYASIDSGFITPLVSFIFKIGIGDAFIEYILLLLGIEWTSQKSSVLI